MTVNHCQQTVIYAQFRRGKTDTGSFKPEVGRYDNIRYVQSEHHILVTLALFLAANVCYAQFTSGVEGTVKDPAGAVVPSCTVVVTDQATGVAYDTRTNESGYFRLTILPPGAYRLEIRQNGFKAWIQTDVVLAAREVRTLSPELAIGKESAQVE